MKVLVLTAARLAGAFAERVKQRGVVPQYSVQDGNRALQPILHGSGRAHVTVVHHGNEAPEPVGQFTNFATGERALGHSTIVPHDAQVQVEGLDSATTARALSLPHAGN